MKIKYCETEAAEWLLILINILKVLGCYTYISEFVFFIARTTIRRQSDGLKDTAAKAL